MRQVLYSLGALVFVGVTAISFVYVRYGGIGQPAQVIMMTAVVPGCGNGIVEDAEECDGSELVGASCTSKGFTTGTLSCTSSCLYNVTACSNVGASGGGGGGRGNMGTSTTNTAQVVFSGLAYPASTVTVVRSGQVVATTVAGTDATFQVQVGGLAAGKHSFSLYTVDGKNARSAMTLVPVRLTRGVLAKVDDIILAPTLTADKSAVKQGESIIFTGSTVPGASVDFVINSLKISTKAATSGLYSISVNSASLKYGTNTAQVSSLIGKSRSSKSTPYSFVVGKITVQSGTTGCFIRGDLNGNCKVNLVDFSILAFWFQKPLSPDILQRERDHLSGDGKMTITDFSIMAYNWTG